MSLWLETDAWMFAAFAQLERELRGASSQGLFKPLPSRLSHILYSELLICVFLLFSVTTHWWEAYFLIEKLFFKLNYLKTDTNSLGLSLLLTPSIFLCCLNECAKKTKQKKNAQQYHNLFICFIATDVSACGDFRIFLQPFWIQGWNQTQCVVGLSTRPSHSQV